MKMIKLNVNPVYFLIIVIFWSCSQNKQIKKDFFNHNHDSLVLISRYSKFKIYNIVCRDFKNKSNFSHPSYSIGIAIQDTTESFEKLYLINEGMMEREGLRFPIEPNKLDDNNYAYEKEQQSKWYKNDMILSMLKLGKITCKEAIEIIKIKNHFLSKSEKFIRKNDLIELGFLTENDRALINQIIVESEEYFISYRKRSKSYRLDIVSLQKHSNYDGKDRVIRLKDKEIEGQNKYIIINKSFLGNVR